MMLQRSICANVGAARRPLSARPASVAPAGAGAAPTAAPAKPKDPNRIGKDELRDLISQKTGSSKVDAKKHLNAVLDSVMESVAQGKTVAVTGFGVFCQRAYAARKGRNPKTGEVLELNASKSAGFRAGTVFKEFVKTGVRPAGAPEVKPAEPKAAVKVVKVSALKVKVAKPADAADAKPAKKAAPKTAAKAKPAAKPAAKKQ